MISSLKNCTRISLVTLFAFIAVFVLSAAAFASIKIEKSGPSPEFTAYQKQLKTGAKVPNYGYVPSPLDWSHLKNVSYTLSGKSGKALKKAPASFDLRPQMPPIKDQNPFGTCWTHSAMAATESSLIKQGLAAKDSIKLAEWYLAYYGYNDEDPASLPAFDLYDTDMPYYDQGGDDWRSVALLSRGTGSVLYSQVKYPTSPADVYKPAQVKRTYKITDALYLGNSSVREVKLVESRRELIKQALMEHGALSIGIGQQGDSQALNKETGAYFYSTTWNGTNHAVTLVGWDDNYPVSKFRADRQPSKPGAWIVRNSWGAGWGDKGYYYVSYEEGSLADGVAYVTKPEPANEKIYQYDPLGVADWYWNRTRKFMAANIFTVAGDNETISSVAFYTAVPDTVCSLKIYTNEGAVPATGTLSAEMTMTIAVPGYHTVTLDAPVAVTKGTKFSVVLEHTVPEGEVAFMATEWPLGGYSSKATANAGESWYYDYYNNNFSDVTKLNDDSKNDNFCIKAFTTLPAAVVKVTSVTFDATSKTLNVGESFTIAATVLPDNATNKALNWTTDNAAVATVSNGVVTAKAAGTAKITATAADGSGKLATCDVTVSGSPAPAPSGSGGGGCNGGFAVLALLALVPVIVRRKK